MNSEEKNRLAEQWLDAGLKALGSAEPQPGLEGRVLANLRAEEEKLSLRWRMWWPRLTTGVIVAIVAAAVIFLTRTPPRRRDTAELASPRRQSAQPEVASAARTVEPDTRRISHRTSRLLKIEASAASKRTREEYPKLDQFPSPQPLSEQEKLLAQYVAERPREAEMVARMRAEWLKADLREFEKGNAVRDEPQDVKR